jgi:hypothetical protein
MALVRRGAASRHQSATAMNDRSSRSHSVFTAAVEARERGAGGLVSSRQSKLNLIDLAGAQAAAPGTWRVRRQ